MMSLSAIADLEKAQAVRAAYNEVEPYTPASASEVRYWKRFPFPNIGSYTPPGWAADETVSVTKGGEDAWAGKGTDAFKVWVVWKIYQNPEMGFAITSESQFLVEVTCFVPDNTVEGDTYKAFECWYCSEPVEVGSEYCPWCDNPIVWSGSVAYQPEYCEKHGEYFEDGVCAECEDEAEERSEQLAAWENNPVEYREGYIASGAHWLPESANPYNPGTAQYNDWKKGWGDAFGEAHPSAHQLEGEEDGTA